MKTGNLKFAFVVFSMFGAAMAATTATHQLSSTNPSSGAVRSMPIQSMPVRPGIVGELAGFDRRLLHKANLQCGIPPIPPLGCKVGDCECDQNGQNCQWTFVCN